MLRKVIGFKGKWGGKSGDLGAWGWLKRVDLGGRGALERRDNWREIFDWGFGLDHFWDYLSVGCWRIEDLREFIAEYIWILRNGGKVSYYI